MIEGSPEDLAAVMEPYGLRGAWWADDRVRAALDGPRSPLAKLERGLVEEMIIWRQGDPDRVKAVRADRREGFGYAGERPNYLYEHRIVKGSEITPWADRLGFAVAQCAASAGWPVIDPLPFPLRGLVILTGDDDQAYLEQYDKQIEAIDGLPITYFLHPLTRHTPETLAKLPGNVEFGVHPDALDDPAGYDPLCREQTRKMSELVGRPLVLVRNHGFLNQGYWGHLKAWQACGFRLDSNLPGVDGTALNGSFLPGRIRSTEGEWTNHWSILTAFGDGMQAALGMTEQQARRRIREVVRMIERPSEQPGAPSFGVLVFNLHPQNIDTTHALHRAAVKLAKRRGWAALGLETYLRWLDDWRRIDVRRADDGEGKRFIIGLPRADLSVGVTPMDQHGRRRPKRVRLDPGLSMPRFEVVASGETTAN